MWTPLGLGVRNIVERLLGRGRIGRIVRQGFEIFGLSLRLWSNETIVVFLVNSAVAKDNIADCFSYRQAR